MRFKGSNVISVMVAAVTILGAQVIEGNDIRKTPAKSKAPIVKAIPKPAVTHMSRLVNCEDQDIQPCWTYDDGKFRIVYSYDPYYSKAIPLCKVEDGGPELPCIWKRNTKGTATRNYFWSKTF